MGFQQLTFMGNLGADAEWFEAGTAAGLHFRVAVTETWRDQGGNKKEATEWFKCTLWGEKRARALFDYLVKGKAVLCTGTLHTRSYEKDGVTRYATDVRIRDLQFAGGGAPQNRGSDDRRGGGRAPQRRAEDDDTSFPYGANGDDDLPPGY